MGWGAQCVLSCVTWRRQNWSSRDSLKVSSQSPYLLPSEGHGEVQEEEKRKKRHICVCCDPSVCQLACVRACEVCVLHLCVIYIGLQYVRVHMALCLNVCSYVCEVAVSARALCTRLVNMRQHLQASAIFKSMAHKRCLTWLPPPSSARLSETRCQFQSKTSLGLNSLLPSWSFIFMAVL